MSAQRPSVVLRGPVLRLQRCLIRLTIVPMIEARPRLRDEQGTTTMPMVEKSFLGLSTHGFHRVAYFEWGDPANGRVVVCVHGLTRRGRDFDILAQALEDSYRVVCVDLPGRGISDWLPIATDYQPSTYVQNMTALIARLGVEQVDWIGVSLGGIIGMTLAMMPKSPIRRLVLDDVGGYIGKEALERIASYVGKDPTFADIGALESYMREVNGPYGPLTDAQWAHVARYGARQDPATGLWHQHYDPRIAEPFKDGFSEPVALWPLWDGVRQPVLVLRGTESDVLTTETLAEMRKRKPEAKVIEFEGVGHAPMIMSADQIGPVREFLLG
ncbi:MAG TPA: alpha/beta hydrolase [Candidatus Defluviicoccus seviourii]|nr:alpha/beta hydrolase [Candidatus Defluviicoccus seviourii]